MKKTKNEILKSLDNIGKMSDDFGKSLKKTLKEVKLLKYQAKYIEHIVKMTNDEVLCEYSYLVCGDDYDGCFTEQGQWKFGRIEAEFNKRLTDCGFFEKK